MPTPVSRRRFLGRTATLLAGIAARPSFALEPVEVPGIDERIRKQAEEALNAQALRYKTLMETSTDSIYVLDQKGNLQEANAAFLRRRLVENSEQRIERPPNSAVEQLFLAADVVVDARLCDSRGARDLI